LRADDGGRREPGDQHEEVPKAFSDAPHQGLQFHHGTDNSIGRSESPEGTESGKGFIDYAPVFAQARLSGIEHCFAEEERLYEVPQLEMAKVDYDNWQRRMLHPDNHP
jgi:hypothetical protein